MEAGPHRFHPVPSSESCTYRPLLFGTLAVMGLLQVDLSTAPHRPIESLSNQRQVPEKRREQTQMLICGDSVTDDLLGNIVFPGVICCVVQRAVLRRPETARKNRRCKNPKESLPSAHLPIKTYQEYSKKGEQAVTIDWDEEHGYCHRMRYQKGKLLVMELGFYYVYAKTCFRYYKHGPEDGSPAAAGAAAAAAVDVRNTQLIQYVYRESIKQNSRAIMLMKTGSTVRLNSTSYNMYCAQQGRGVRLEEGDTLFVNVSNAWMLDLEGEGTYFGAIKLGN
ncbi:tumor necrosis factor ligand superfamily member 11 [Solea senegalensis]|uniref:Tumor necrosis factor ligand superfamily member 11 n=1 Tax=Solea senegalensis TaxID=28829 RepID=A0AAV6PGK5_SOLSE|nr:tumor necrosis factor ligand superfamily member 11 [Solea senegalensis]